MTRLKEILRIAVCLCMMICLTACGSLISHYDVFGGGEEAETSEEEPESEAEEEEPEPEAEEEPEDSEESEESEESTAPEDSEESEDTEADAEADLTDISEEAAAVIPYFSNKYLLNQLSDEMLCDFLALYQAVAAFEDSVTYPYPLTETENSQLAHLLVYECPEMFQYDREATYTYYFKTGEDAAITSREIVYTVSEATYDAMYAEVDAAVKAIAAEMETLGTDDQELFLYQYLIDLNTYDLTTDNAENSYGTLIEHLSKCDGIALTFKWVMDVLGVPNYILAGDDPDDSDGHAWNVIRTEEGWADLDITNDDWGIEDENVYPYGFYNVGSSAIRERYVIRDVYDGLNIPGTSGMDLSYHVQNGTYVASGDTGYDIFAAGVLEALDAGGGSFSFQFASDADYEAFIALIQTYVDDIADAYQVSYSLVLHHSSSSRAVWCRITPQ